MKVEKGFLSDLRLVQEDSKVDDLLDLSSLVLTFSDKIESVESPALLGLVGVFGSGKSTMLYQVEKLRKKKEKWINFDAWKYPDRKGLWEGFVLDFADQIGERGKASRKIDGKSTKSKVLDIVTDVIPAITDKLPNFDFLDKFVEIFKSSPAKRVFEIQKILTELINKQESDIVVVVEDSDRSGQAGIYFLETLRQFLKVNTLSRKVLVIVPIGDLNYRRDDEAYFKCLDYVEHFNPRNIGLAMFVQELILPACFDDVPLNVFNKPAWTPDHRRGQVTSFLEELLKLPSFTIRRLKAILRGAQIAFNRQAKSGHEPDWTVTLCMEAAKHMSSATNNQKTVYEEIYETRKVLHGTITASFLYAIANNLPNIYDMNKSTEQRVLAHCPADIHAVPRTTPIESQRQPSWPWKSPDDYLRDTPQIKYGMCDFYLD